MALAICAVLDSPVGRASTAGDFARASTHLPASGQARSDARFVPEFRDLFIRWRAHDTLRPAPVVVRILTEKAWVQAEARYAIRRRLPVAARQVTSGFGWRAHPVLGSWRQHSGIDLAAPLGAPIVAPSDGVVGAAGWNGGYGLSVALQHGGGLETRYGHMSRLAVIPGQHVRRGAVIGYVGSTGLSTGPHLHYEMRIDGRAVDPFARKP